MVCLPQELVDLVCKFLTTKELKNVVNVSRSFQYAAERASGAFAEFDLTEDNAQKFLSLYGGRHRSYLRHIRYRTHIPPYVDRTYVPPYVYDDSEEEDGSDGKTNLCRESLQELQEKDELFTSQISFVFATIRSIEGLDSTANLRLTIYTPVREVTACPHRKCISWRLRLRDPGLLPEINSVRALYLEDEHIVFPLEKNKSLLKINLRVLIDLAVKLPNLEFLKCKIGAGSGWTDGTDSNLARYYGRDWPGPHRDSRHDFAKAMKAASLPLSLREARLDFLHPLSDAEDIDQTQSLPDLTSPAAYDPFSFGLSLLSRQLRKLDLQVVADATLFWPTEGGAHWPNLESIHVLFHISTPSGRWYFEGPGGYGREARGIEVTSASYPALEDTPEDKTWDEDSSENDLDLSTGTSLKFRVQPTEEVLVPFLKAFATAASHMPRLNEARLWAPLQWWADDLEEFEDYDDPQFDGWNMYLAWGITYLSASSSMHYTPTKKFDSAVRRLWWKTADWRPSREIHSLFRQIGDQTVGLDEHWGHEDYGQRLIEQRVISYDWKS